MCSWERFSSFAREPERRKVGIDARVIIYGTAYEVEPGLAGETVILLWGLFDNDLYVEHQGQRFGPFHPISGPIPCTVTASSRKARLMSVQPDRAIGCATQSFLDRLDN